MRKHLTAPIHIGDVATIGPGTLTIHTIFDEDTGNFEVSAIQMSVREGEIVAPEPYEFIGRRTGLVERSADEIPAAILKQIEALLKKCLEVYAVQKGYELEAPHE